MTNRYNDNEMIQGAIANELLRRIDEMQQVINELLDNVPPRITITREDPEAVRGQFERDYS